MKYVQEEGARIRTEKRGRPPAGLSHGEVDASGYIDRLRLNGSRNATPAAAGGSAIEVAPTESELRTWTAKSQEAYWKVRWRCVCTFENDDFPV